MTLSDQPTGNPKLSLTFHDAYLVVIYGLVATEGLKAWVSVNSDSVLHFRIPGYFFLFLGVFVIGLHFWFTCASIESRATNFYCALVRPRQAKSFLLLDELVATGFAGIVLAMFFAIPEHLNTLFRWFVAAGFFSFVYDGYSTILVWFCKKPSPALAEYKKEVRHWFVQDTVFLLGALLVLVVVRPTSENSYLSQVTLLGISVAVLVFDVESPESSISTQIPLPTSES